MKRGKHPHSKGILITHPSIARRAVIKEDHNTELEFPAGSGDAENVFASVAFDAILQKLQEEGRVRPPYGPDLPERECHAVAQKVAELRLPSRSTRSFTKEFVRFRESLA